MIGKLRKTWELIIGMASREDAVELYKQTNQELNALLEYLKIGEWGKDLDHYKHLKSNNLHLLFPPSLQKLLECFINRKTEFNKLKEKSDKIVITLIPDYGVGYNDTDDQALSGIYQHLLNGGFDIPNLEHITKNKGEYMKSIKKKEVQSFLKFIKETLKEGEFLSKELINQYRWAVSLPEGRKNILTLTQIFLTIILGLSTLYLTINLTPPLQPELYYFFDSEDNDRFLSNWDLAQPTKYSDDKTIEAWRKSQLEFNVRNIGQLPAGWVDITIENSNFYTPKERIEDLRGLDTKVTDIEIWYKTCEQRRRGDECNPSLVPLGIHFFNLTIDCQTCEQLITDRIRICVYNGSNEQDCEEVW